MGTAMIWGAGGGIGRALVARLAAEDWTVVALSRRPVELADLAAYSIEVELSDPRAVERAALSVPDEVERVDLWIYAAGDITSAKVAEMPPGTWRRILAAYHEGYKGVLDL